MVVQRQCHIQLALETRIATVVSALAILSILLLGSSVVDRLRARPAVVQITINRDADWWSVDFWGSKSCSVGFLTIAGNPTYGLVQQWNSRDVEAVGDC